MRMISSIPAVLFAGILSFLLCGCGKKDNTRQFLDGAKKHYDAGELEKAKAEYLKVLNVSSRNREATAQLVRIFSAQGNLNLALSFLGSVRELEPENIELRTIMLRGLMTMWGGTPDKGQKEVIKREALKEVVAILNLDPGHEQALLQLAALLDPQVTAKKTAGDEEKAEDEKNAEDEKKAEDEKALLAQRVAAVPDQNSFAVHLIKGLAARRSSEPGAAEAARFNFKAAEQQAQKALVEDPKSIPARMALAVLLGLKGDAAGEERILKEVAEIAPVRSPERLKLAERKLLYAQGILGLDPHGMEKVRPLLDEARAAATESVTKAPDYLPALLLLANVEKTAKNPAAMRECAGKILEVDPAHPDGRFLMGQALLEEGKGKEAAEIFEAIVKAGATSDRLQFLLASAYALANDTDKALPLLGALTAKKPDFPEATEAAQLLASVKIARGREQEAIPELQAAIKKLQAAIKELPAAIKELEEKIKNLNKAIEDAGKAEDRAELVRKGAELVRKRAELVRKRAEVARLPEEFLKFSLLLTDAYQKAGQFDEASAVVEGLIRSIEPGSDKDLELRLRLRLQLGILKRQAAKPEEARAAFESVLKHAPDNLPAELQLEVNKVKLAAIVQLVEIDLAGGNFDSAMQRIQPLLAKAPVPVEGLQLQGVILSGQKKWDEAEAAFLKALEVKPDYEPALRALIDTYVKANKTGLAMERLTKQLEARPDDIHALSAAALICESGQEFDKAVQYYEKLLSLKPDLPLVLNNLANLHLTHRKDAEKAYQLALKARNLRPAGSAPVIPEVPDAPDKPGVTLGSLSALEPAVIADTLGWIQFHRKEYAEALKLIREAHAGLSGNGEVNYHLGLACLMMGDFDGAKAAFAAAVKPELRLPEDFPGRAEIQKYTELLASPRSLKELEALAGGDPENPAIALLLARACEAEQDMAKAEAAYRSAIKSSPKMLPAWIGLAGLLAREPASQAQALEMLKQARQMDPSPAQLGELGSIALRAGDHAWAQPLLSQSVTAGGGDVSPALLEDLARACYLGNRVVEARKHMQQALDLLNGASATPAGDVAARASAFIKLTGLDEAGAAEALQADADSVPAKVFQAGRLIRQGKTAEAEAICKSLMDRYPAFAPARAKLAEILVAAEATRGKAKELANEARQILERDDPDLSMQPDLLLLLGRLSFYERDYSRAVQLLKRIPGDQLRPEGQVYLGISLCRDGDKAGGADLLKRAVEQPGLPDPLRAEATKVLAEEGK